MPLITRDLLKERATREDLVRPSGYYWVQFPYPDEARRIGIDAWEPAGWDAGNYSWVMLGSTGIWMSEQLVAVGPPLAPIVRS